NEMTESAEKNFPAYSHLPLQSLQDDSWREIATARGLAQAKQFSWENCTTQTINAYKLL
ncbi:glycosyltransferase family 1 protein, partial [Escherichia coli]|nr:glycosyltransferase family 1 protein [Escherichia coli]